MTDCRRRLPDTRKSVTHKFEVANHEGYITVGLFEDGTPGELFIKMSKMGSTISGLMDGVGVMASLGLQHGVSVDLLANKMRQTRFEPMDDKSTSVLDCIFGWLQDNYGESEKCLTDV